MTELAEVLDLLDLERVGSDVFRGWHPASRPPRVFGGQVLAQALKAAGTTVPEGRLPNSLHAYFIRGGLSTTPIDYEIARLRDGGTFSVRRVSALQGGDVIFEMITSFCAPMAAPHDARRMPAVPPAATLPTIQERLAGYGDECDGWWVRPRPFEMRYVGSTPREALTRPAPPEAVGQVWVKPIGVAPADALTILCLVTYLSDMSLLDPVMIANRRTTMGPGSIASLDHAMWFHQVPDLNDWLLYDKQADARAERRGLASGWLYQPDGALVCSVVQECYLTEHRPRHWQGPRLDASIVH